MSAAAPRPTTAAGHGTNRREAVLNGQQSSFLMQLLVGNDPLQLHFESPLWTPQALAEVVKDEFELQLSSDELQRCLGELGLLPCDPLLALDHAHQARYLRWIEQELPRRLQPAQVPWWISEQTRFGGDSALSVNAHASAGQRRATVLTAVSGSGQIAWWFCRGNANAQARFELVSRLQRMSPGCVLLLCGMDRCYDQATAMLGVSPDVVCVIDVRDELDSAPAASSRGLFRQEVYVARERRLEGEVLVLQPLPTRLLTLVVQVLLLSMLVFGTFGHYARTQGATGVLMPASGVVRLQAPQPGVLQHLQVRIGDRVHKGQALVSILSAQVDADGSQADNQIVDELQRALSILSSEATAGAEQNALERLRLTAVLTAAQAQYTDLNQQYALQQQQQSLLNDNLERSRTLARRGVIARVQLQGLEQQALSGRVQTLSLSRERAAAATAIDEASNRLAQHPLQTRQHDNALAQRRAELEQRLAQARLRTGVRLQSPANGRVAALFVAVGSSVDAGAPLLLIVDDQAPLIAELYVPSRAIGFIRTGQRVQLKLDAFAYQKYGFQRGTVAEISGAALATRDLDTNRAFDEPMYRVRVALEAQRINADGVQHALTAGMQVQADIVIDRPRIADWLLEPLYALRGRSTQTP